MKLSFLLDATNPPHFRIQEAALSPHLNVSKGRMWHSLLLSPWKHFLHLLTSFWLVSPHLPTLQTQVPIAQPSKLFPVTSHFRNLSYSHGFKDQL